MTPGHPRRAAAAFSLLAVITVAACSDPASTDTGSAPLAAGS